MKISICQKGRQIHQCIHSILHSKKFSQEILWPKMFANFIIFAITIILSSIFVLQSSHMHIWLFTHENIILIFAKIFFLTICENFGP